MENRGKFSIERLVHYQCGYEDCKGWWTIGDGQTGEILACPRCGRYQAFDEAEPLPTKN